MQPGSTPLHLLQELGYSTIGIDEGWEGCGMGVRGTQHYANGTPAVNAKFPDLEALVEYVERRPRSPLHHSRFPTHPTAATEPSVAAVC